MMKWLIFGGLWTAGLFLGDMLVTSGFVSRASVLVLFGGVWMVVCLTARDVTAAYQEAKVRTAQQEPKL